LRTVIDLLRHGEPVGGRRYRGQQDDPLSDTGWAQMRASCAEQTWDAVVSSPLQRCARFAEELVVGAETPLVVDQALSELGYGAWEGLTPEALRVAHTDLYAAYCQDPHLTIPPGGEALPAFQQRVLAAWEKYLDQWRGKRLLIVAHTGVIRIILLHAMGSPLSAYRNITIPYAGLARLTAEHLADGRRLRWHWHGATTPL
jgi:alpha-ribazole phosphatase/probable phosphoglycerate mutase